MIHQASLPLVTIVTPSYNQGRFIEETILSVLRQDYPRIEYLVVDGGSTDNTLDILRKFERRLTWISEPDRGQSDAINKGFRMASGDIVCWLNSDDTYELGAIQRAVDLLCANPDVMMVYGSANLIDEAGEFIGRIAPEPVFDLWSVVYHAQTIPQPATFFRRKIFDEIDMLDEQLHWCMDRDLWIRIGSRFAVKGLCESLANCRLYAANKTSSGGIKRLREIVSVQKKYANWTFPYGLVRASMGSLHTMLKFRHPFLYRYLKRLVYYVKNRSLDNFYRNFHGVYADRWLARRARFMFPLQRNATEVRFVLEFPDDWRLPSNHLTAKSGGKIVAKRTIFVPGRYELRVPHDRNATRPTEIELIFSRSLPPDSQRRRLACTLVSVDFVS